MGIVQATERHRAALISPAGLFLGHVEWGADDEKPRLPPSVAVLVEHPDALNPPAPMAKWDWANDAWVMPPLHLWIIDANGTPRTDTWAWPDSIPPAPAGMQYVDEPPPGPDWVWSFAAGAWDKPKPVYLGRHPWVGETVALENPNNPTPPPGYYRVADVDDPGLSAEIMVVKDDNGNEVARGRVKTDLVPAGYVLEPDLTVTVPGAV